MISHYDEGADRWTLSLRSKEVYGCEPATHLLMEALGGPGDDIEVRIGDAVVELYVEDGRLVQLTVNAASTVLQDDVLFDAAPVFDDGPF